MKSLLFASILSALTGMSCTASVDSDLEPFVADQGCDLALNLRDFQPHDGQRFEARLVDEKDGGRIERLVIVDKLGHPNVNIHLENGVDPLRKLDDLPQKIEFFADFNGDGIYTSPPSDHSWVIDSCGDPEFKHNLDFDRLHDPATTPNAQAGSLFVTLRNIDPGLGLEVRVERHDETLDIDRTIGAFHVDSSNNRRNLSPKDITLPGLIDIGFNHRVSVWMDRPIDGARVGNNTLDNSDFIWTVDHRAASPVECPAQVNNLQHGTLCVTADNHLRLFLDLNEIEHRANATGTLAVQIVE